MTKKNLRPQQAAPVQRETNITSSKADTGLGLLPLFRDFKDLGRIPFAGDDAE